LDRPIHTILWVDRCVKDPDTGVHTIQILVRKQKDGEDGQRYYMQSRKVSTPHGDSLVLVPCSEDVAKGALSSKTSKPLGPEDVRAALRNLCRGGGHVTTTRLVKELDQLLPGKAEGTIRNALNAQNKPGMRFHEFVYGAPGDGNWSLLLKDMAAQTLADTLADDRNDSSDDAILH
jgi:hypothetical protein